MIQNCIISTVIPVYNVENYLRRTLESLITQQGFNHVEVLLIDDGSTDSSGLICDDYASNYENITVHHIENAGVSHARNFGLQKAKGDYVHFMDSDDELWPNMYGEFLNVCIDKKPDILVGGVERINIIKGTTVFAGPHSTQFYFDNISIVKFFKNLGTEDERWVLDYIWNKFFKRKVILENNIKFTQSLSIGEDFEFNCKFLCKARKIYATKSIVYKYFIRDSGLVTAFHAEPHVWRERLYQIHIELYKTWNCLTSERINTIKKFRGKRAFASLRSINNSRCKLSKKEKSIHIRNMLNSPQYDNILFYCRTDSRLKQKCFYLILKNKSVISVNIIIFLDKMLHFKEKLKCWCMKKK